MLDYQTFSWQPKGIYARIHDFFIFIMWAFSILFRGSADIGAVVDVEKLTARHYTNVEKLTAHNPAQPAIERKQCTNCGNPKCSMQAGVCGNWVPVQQQAGA